MLSFVAVKHFLFGGLFHARFVLCKFPFTTLSH